LIIGTPSDNKKEKYYTLTEKGGELAGAHAKVYEQIVRHYVKVFKTFTDEEINTIIRFLNNIWRLPNFDENCNYKPNKRRNKYTKYNFVNILLFKIFPP
jgi:DNA-binding PadR family transcriptional regulator